MWRCGGVCRRWCTVCMACVGTVYGAMALGVCVWCTCVYALGVRCVYRYIDVVSV